MPRKPPKTPPDEEQLQSPSRSREVSAEEAELWRRVGETLDWRMDRRGAGPGSGRDADEQAKAEAAAVDHGKGSNGVLKGTKPAPGEGGGRQRRPASGPPKSVATKPAQPPLAVFESRKARRLKAGRLEIEARIDLHGLRQAEAHGALIRFLRGAQARGLRHVKVITGKGGRRGEPDERPIHESEERGVLRRAVPIWLAEPELRSVVVSYTEAGRGHGGEGALYVQLRRLEKGR
ncbi:MAG: Smr/MutS family protein [Hyphomicrobiaceae bacterium]